MGTPIAQSVNPLVKQISRRQACRHLLTAVAATCGAAAFVQAAAPPAFALRYIVASSMYGNLPLAEILPEVRRAGARDIDIWPKRHGTQREQIDEMGADAFATLLEKHRVRLGMLTRYDLGPTGVFKEIPFARRFGAKIIVTGAGKPAGLKGAELRSAVKTLLEQMKPGLDAAAEAGITLAIENHANSLIESADSIRHLAELAHSLPVGIALAPYHLPQDPQLIAQLIRDLGGKLAHFYAWQHGNGSTKPMPKDQEMLQLPGHGPLDFLPLLSALKDIRYAGWTSVFMHPFPRGLPILPTAAQVTDTMIRANKHLEGLLQKA